MQKSSLKTQIKGEIKIGIICFVIYMAFILWLFGDDSERICKIIWVSAVFFILAMLVFNSHLLSIISYSEIEKFFTSVLDARQGIVKDFTPTHKLFSFNGKTALALDSNKKKLLLIRRENNDIHSTENFIKIYKFSDLTFSELTDETTALDIYVLKFVLSLKDIDHPVFEIVLFSGVVNDHSRNLYNVQWDLAQEWLQRLNIVANDIDED